MGKAFKAAGRVLSHPVISAAGNVYTLVSIVPGAGAILTGVLAYLLNARVLGVIAIGLTVITVIAVYLQSRKAPLQAEEPAPSPPPHGYRIEGSKDVRLEGNEAYGFDVGIGIYNSELVEEKDNTVTASGQESPKAVLAAILAEGEQLMERLDQLPVYKAQNEVDAWTTKADAMLRVHVPDKADSLYTKPSRSLKQEMIEQAQEANSITGYPATKRQLNNRLRQLDLIVREL